MATEAKFRITDPGIFWSLQTIEQLGKFSFGTPKIFEIDDAYLDTKKRRLLAAGYCCRRREQDKGFLITLSKLGLGKDATKKHQKWEVSLKKNKFDPKDWSKSQARNRILKITPNKKLQIIFALDQTRITRQIRKGKQTIGQANLDDVLLINNGKEQHFKILEFKISNPNQEKHLNSLIEALQAKWSLKIEMFSKFERALALEKGKIK